MNSQDLQNLQEAYMEVYEGAAAEHPDIANQSEFQKKADEVLKQRQKKRVKKVSPELPSFVKRIKNEEFVLDERYKSLPIDKMTNKIETKRKINRMPPTVSVYRPFVQSLNDVIRKSDNIDKITKTINTHDPLESRFKELENKDRGEKKPKTKLEKNYELSSDGKYRKRSSVKKEEFEVSEATYKPSKPTEPVDTRRVVTATDKKGNTEAWKRYQAGHKGYKAASHLGEKIDVGANAGATISDFVHSKSATFKGDSKKQRIKRALGAYYAAQKEETENIYNYVIETLIDSEFAEDYETANNMFEHMSSEFVAVILEEYIEEKARGTRPKRTVHAYDVDETLVGHGKKGKTNVKVHVNDASGKRVKSLSNQEFNTHKLDNGHSYDFSEFRSAKKFGETSSANKKVIKDVKRKQARGQNVHIITARAKFDNPSEFQGHLKKKGVDVPINKIHYTGGMKGSDIGKKKVDVAKGVAKQSGAKKIHMYDDAAKVHKAFEKEKENKPTSTTIKTHLAKPNASGETTLRSYQGTKGGRTSDNPSSTTKQTQRRRNKARKNMGEEVSSYLNIEEGNFKGEAMSYYYQETQEDFDLKDKLFISFSGTSKAKNELKEETEMTPYEQWKSFIKENEVEEFEESAEIETELKEDSASMNSYHTWKSYLESI
jgi:hypothetical protein